MSKIKFNGVLNNVQRTLVQHSPEILTGLGIAGSLSAIVLAVKATPKAMEAIDYIELSDDQDAPSTGQIVKATWKYYIPTALTFAASTACVIGGHSVSSKRAAALATAYQLSQQALTEYKDKVVETLGEKKEKKIRDSVIEDHINANPPASSEIIITGKDGVLCYDNWSGRYFKADLTELDKIENELNQQLINEMYVSLNEFYNRINLPNTNMGDSLGWNMDGGLIRIDKHYIGAEDGSPCVAIDFFVEPRFDYTRLM